LKKTEKKKSDIMIELETKHDIVLLMYNKVREAQEALSESGRPDIELILGGTTLLTPDDMLELLLGKSSYF
jgi:hypothetical protein